jgi:hypothetical protein
MKPDPLNPSNPNNNSELEVSKLAIASFIIGLLSFVHMFGFEKAFVSVIMGLVALRQISKTNKTGKVYAVFGIVASVIFMLLFAGFVLYQDKTLLP